MHEIWTVVTGSGAQAAWIRLLLMLLAAVGAGRLARHLLHGASKRAAARSHPATAAVFDALSHSATLVMFALAFRIGGGGFGGDTGRLFDSLAGVLVAVAVAHVALGLIEALVVRMSARLARGRDGMDGMIVPVVRTTLRVSVLVLLALQVAQMLTDRPLTSILAGLGVGGLAVALAAQDTLKNFFGSLVIFADKPFAVGERVLIDSIDGTVEQVGFRSTRIRTLDGHWVTIPNGELANKTIQNIGRRPHIRRVLNLTLTYDMPPARVRRARAVVEELLKDHEGLAPAFPPRVFFDEFNADSLNLKVIYWYHPADYWAYMAFTERFNLAVLERFAAEGIELAFPTQTLRVKGDPPHWLGVVGTPADAAGREGRI